MSDEIAPENVWFYCPDCDEDYDLTEDQITLPIMRLRPDGKFMIKGWNKLNDREKLEYLVNELERRGVLTIEEWDHYNRLFKAVDPKGYEHERAAVHKR